MFKVTPFRIFPNFTLSSVVVVKWASLSFFWSWERFQSLTVLTVGISQMTCIMLRNFPSVARLLNFSMLFLPGDDRVVHPWNKSQQVVCIIFLIFCWIWLLVFWVFWYFGYFGWRFLPLYSLGILICSFLVLVCLALVSE